MNRFADKNYFRKPEDYRLVSGTESRYEHIEAYEKVTGRAMYAGDFHAPDMLYAKAKLSPVAHARIVSIDTSKAEAYPGVKCVLTGKDFPDIKVGGHGKGANKHFSGEKTANVGDGDQEILCKTEVRMCGDPVAAVCATSEAAAQRAVDLIEAVYEELPACFDPREAAEADSPDVQGYGREAHNFGPCCTQLGSNVGKTVDEEFERAAYIYKGDFSTHHIVHACMEPHACYCEYDAHRDQYTVHVSSTMTYSDQYWLARVFETTEDHFNIVRTHVGGAFGGKSNFPFIEFVACRMAQRTGHPVRFVLTREEEFITQQGRHPFLMHVETAFDDEHKIIAKRCRQLLDGGAYGLGQVASVNLSVIWAAFPYKIDTIDLQSKRVFTNKSPNGAMRGYTACQVQFAGDLSMQYAAEHLGVDPIEFRKISALETGYKSPAGLVVTSCAFKQTLDDAAKHMDWVNRRAKLEKNEGIGFSGIAFVSGTASPILNTPNQIQTNATVRVDWNGIPTVYANCHDNGQGADTVMTMIVAEELGLDMKDVKHADTSTFNAGYDSGAYGSRVTFLGGNAVRRAAVDVKRQICEAVAAKWNCDPHLIDCIDHKVVCRDMGREDLEMPWKDAVTCAMYQKGGDEVVGVGSYYHRTNSAQYHGKPSNYAPSYVFSTGACHLTVDEETGVVDIDEFFFAHDCGQALNKRAVEGQLEGSIYSGIGYTLYEDLKDVKGKQINTNFHDYKMPTALDMPHITTKFDYPPDPEGPFGAKECGEGTTAPIAPAVANAIHMATGVEIHDLPLDPEHVWRLLREQKDTRDEKWRWLKEEYYAKL